jgi:hypothetical protein
MTDTRKWIILGASSGIGFAFALAGVWAIWAGHHSQPDVWDRKAVTATFDELENVSALGKLVFHYVLHNNAPTDYALSETSTIQFMIRSSDRPTLLRVDLTPVPFGHPQDVKLEDLPVFIPGKESVPFSFTCHSIFLGGPGDPLNATVYGESVKDIAGFVLFDTRAHYRIELPRGW